MKLAELAISKETLKGGLRPNATNMAKVAPEYAKSYFLKKSGTIAISPEVLSVYLYQSLQRVLTEDFENKHPKCFGASAKSPAGTIGSGGPKLRQQAKEILGKKLGINVAVIYSQMCHETAFFTSFKFGKLKNTCGMKLSSRDISIGSDSSGFAKYKSEKDSVMDYLLRQAQYNISLVQSDNSYATQTLGTGFDQGLPSAYLFAWKNTYKSIFSSSWSMDGIDYNVPIFSINETGGADLDTDGIGVLGFFKDTLGVPKPVTLLLISLAIFLTIKSKIND